jgi:UDPglucose--hexose-1-phosphate uridylyltransferase
MTSMDPGPGVQRLLRYARQRGLIEAEDTNWAINRVLEVLRLDSPGDAWVGDAETDDGGGVESDGADAAVAQLLDVAVATGLIADTQGRRDLLDAAIFGALLPRPSEVIEDFWRRYQTNPRAATDAFYHLSVAANYIHADRSARNPTWVHPSRYGAIDMTINLAKPEKDPRDIIAAGQTESTDYPACLLCPQNEGYRGRLDHPARQNLRLIPMELADRPWAMQYSPYLYYPEHCIVLSAVHEPMRLTRQTFTRLLTFVEMFPEYFLGSNADLPIVGGSILSHDHFQGGRYQFPIERAQVLYTCEGPHEIQAQVLDWPLSALRLTHEDPQILADAGFELLEQWRGYDESETDVRSHSNGEDHNTVTPIARRSGKQFQLDLVLRNNRTSQEHPDGIFHPHAEIHPVKKENIGLIEVMGLAVLPGRLAGDIPRLAQALVTGDIPTELSTHAPMLEQIAVVDDAEAAVKAAIGDYFVRGLEHCGVFGDSAESVPRWQRLLGTLDYNVT